ncbi:hypothetical protein EON67_07025 [archaeon]|nr:MAG: hypothetical protein EON67_07025 [archaeon]
MCSAAGRSQSPRTPPTPLITTRQSMSPGMCVGHCNQWRAMHAHHVLIVCLYAQTDFLPQSGVCVYTCAWRLGVASATAGWLRAHAIPAPPRTRCQMNRAAKLNVDTLRAVAESGTLAIMI